MVAVTFDTNVLISATLWDGSVANKLLLKLIRSDSVIYSTSEILDEYSKILKRDFRFQDEEVSHIVGIIRGFATIIMTRSDTHLVAEDPADDKIIDCALDSGSEFMITYDNHLLKIGAFNGIKIVRPEEFMRRLPDQG